MNRYRVYLEYVEDVPAGDVVIFATDALAYSVEGLKERNEETYKELKATVVAIRCLDDPEESRVY